MEAILQNFLRQHGPTLCVDIGSGTQDALLARPGLESHNWPRFVLPAPARLVAQRIRELTLLRRPVWLYGGNMGGGFGQAVREHVAAGLPLAATLAASRALHDREEVVRGMGVTLAEQCPPDHVPLYLTDYAPEFWASLLRHAGLPLPHLVLASAQDHGESAQGNRAGRMQHWTRLLEHSGKVEDWLMVTVPQPMTRLRALQDKTGGPVADTGTSILLGALSEPEVMDRSYRQGITIINVGNGHTVAALVYKGIVRGIYEHHTGMRTRDELLADLEQFRKTWLPAEEVRATGGHGTAFAPYCEEAGGYEPTYILGPKRELLAGQGKFLNPGGDMMQAGSFGLLWGWARRQAQC